MEPLSYLLTAILNQLLWTRRAIVLQAQGAMGSSGGEGSEGSRLSHLSRLSRRVATQPGGGGGGYSPKFRIGVCRERFQTLTLSKDKENEN